MDNQFGYVDVSGEFLWEGLVTLAEATVWRWRNIDDNGVRVALRAIAAVCERTEQHALHAGQVGFGSLRDGVFGKMDDRSVLAVGILHSVAVLVTNSLDAEWASSSDAYVEDEVVAVGWGRREGHCRVSGLWQGGGSTMEAGGGAKDSLIGDRNLKSGDVDLLRAAEELLRLHGSI